MTATTTPQLLDPTGLPLTQYWDGTQWVVVTSDTPMPTTGSGTTAHPGVVQIASLYYPQSSGNNSTAQLLASGRFNGAIESVLALQAAQIMIRCDTAYSYTINQFEDAAGSILVASTTTRRVAGQATNVNVLLSGNYFQLVVVNLSGAAPTTTLAINTTFGIMPTTNNEGNQVVNEPSVSGVVALTVGAALVAAGRQLLVNCTVAGNIAVTFTDGSTLTIPVTTGLSFFAFAVTGVNTSGTTATATYYNLK